MTAEACSKFGRSTLCGAIAFFIAILCAALPSVLADPAASTVDPEAAAAFAEYGTKRTAALESSTKDLEALGDKFVGALERLKSEKTKAGDLPRAIAARDAILVFKGEAKSKYSKKVEPVAFPELDSLHATYAEQKDLHWKREQNALRALIAEYDAKLGDRETALTKAEQLDSAVAVHGLRQQMGEHLATLEAAYRAHEAAKPAEPDRRIASVTPKAPADPKKAMEAAAAIKGDRLPLKVGTKWLLRPNVPQIPTPVTMVVKEQAGTDFRLVLDNPFVPIEFFIQPQGSLFYLNKLKLKDAELPVPHQLFFNTRGKKGETWTNEVGFFEILDDNRRLEIGKDVYEGCVHQLFRAKDGTEWYWTFAPSRRRPTRHQRSRLLLDAAASTAGGCEVGRFFEVGNFLCSEC
ncbi:MAG: hypothetical protein R3F11_21805 [Verrucomicrobiales bacterium]